MSDGLMLALRLTSIAVSFPLLAWLFGSAVLRRFTSLDREECFAASFGVGFAAEALFAFGGFVLHAPQPLFNAGAVLLMLAVSLLYHLTTEKRPADGPSPWPLAALFALAYLHLVCIQVLLPAYWGSYWYFDWWMHYDEARVFVGLRDVGVTWANGYTLASRTPLFNLTTAFVMGLDRPEFATYQLASAPTNIAFVLAVYLLLRDLFGRRAAWLGLLLAPLNLWMLHNAWFTWPKMLAAYYMILALHLFLRALRERRADPARAANYSVCFLAASLLGFMAHQVAVFYILPLQVMAAVLPLFDRAYRPRLYEVVAGAVMALAVAGPWYAWLAGTLGTDKILKTTPASLGDDKAKLRPEEIAKWMGFNTSASVVPVGLGQAFLTPVPADADAPRWSVEVADGDPRWFLGPPSAVELHRGVTQLYFSLLTGAVTVSLTVFLLVAAFRRLRRGPALPTAKTEPVGRPAWWAVALFLIVGTLGGALLHPGKIAWGIAHSAVFPSSIVLAALAWGLLSRASPRAALVVCCGMVLEFALTFWSYLWLLFHDPGVIEPDITRDSLYDPDVTVLNQVVGHADLAFLVGAAVVQAALVCLLLAWVLGRRREVITEEAR